MDKLGTRCRVAAALLTATVLSLASPLGAQTACFAGNGQLICFDGRTATRARAVEAARGAAPQEVTWVWGQLSDGRVVARLDDVTTALTDEERGARKLRGARLGLVRPDGVVDYIAHGDAVRAYPNPGGDTIAIINTARQLSIWQDGNLREANCEGKVSAAAWSPDGNRLVLTIYPADWSPEAVNNARTTETFLRLQCSRLILLDPRSCRVLGTLVSNSGTNYNPFFSPDGRELYYIWLDPREDAGGLMRLVVDKDGGTSSSETPRQLTRAGEDPGKIPLGRVGTYKWANDGRDLVFEAGMPDESGVLWIMSRTGAKARSLGPGRFPQMLGTSTLAFLAPGGEPVAVQVGVDQ